MTVSVIGWQKKIVGQFMVLPGEEISEIDRNHSQLKIRLVKFITAGAWGYGVSFKINAAENFLEGDGHCVGEGNSGVTFADRDFK